VNPPRLWVVNIPYPAQAHKILPPALPLLNIRVINKGHPGADSSRIPSELENNLDIYKPRSVTQINTLQPPHKPFPVPAL
jgi:hypothetical protein